MRSGLQGGPRGLERLDAGEMRAVGARAGDDVGMAVEQAGRARVLDHGRERLDDVDQAALVAGREAQQHGRHIGAGERGRERVRERRRVGDLGASPDRGAGRGAAVGPIVSGRHGAVACPGNRADLGAFGGSVLPAAG